MDDCSAQLTRINTKGKKAANAASALVWVDLATSVLTATTAGIAALQAPGSGSTTVTDAVAKERQITPIEVVGLVVGAITMASAGATVALGAQTVKRQTEANDIGKLMAQLDDGRYTDIDPERLNTLCNHSKRLAPPLPPAPAVVAPGEPPEGPPEATPTDNSTGR